MQIVLQPNNSNVIRASLLAFAVIAPFLSIALVGSGFFAALGPLFVSHMLMLYPTLVANCQWWGPVFTRFQTSEQEVWLTIDDGPTPEQTPAILEILERFEARATFFVIGANAEKYPHLITEILARGHALANHTYTHPRAMFWCASAAKIRSEIDRCAETLRTLPERPALFFRSPVGMKNLFVHPALARRGMVLIGWTTRGLDTVKRDPTAVAERIEKGVQPGAIILLHEGQRLAKEPEFNPRCIERTLQRLATHGYRFVIPRPEQLRT